MAGPDRHGARTAQQLGQGHALLRRQLQGLPASVGIDGVVDQELPATATMGDDADPLAGPGGELVADADARQRGLVDLGHERSLALRVFPPAEWLTSRRVGSETMASAG